MDEAAFVLENLLRCVMSLGLLVLFFGQGYAKMALFLYGGKNLAYGLGTKLLKTHCLAIVLMAINGSTECYALSTMNTKELNKWVLFTKYRTNTLLFIGRFIYFYVDRYNRIMVIFSIGFLVAAWILSYLFGSVGFIFANCCNMSARIIYRFV